MLRESHSKAPWTMPLIREGLALREDRVPYRSIAVIYRRYHNFDVGECAVRSMLRKHGADGRPRGSAAGLLRGPRA